MNSLDIGQKTIKIFQEKILQSKTVLWYGSLGKIEEGKYVIGTLAIAEAIIKNKAFSIVGGSKVIDFLEKQGLISNFSYVSFGGDAILQYLSGDILPGLVALE